MCDLPDLSVLYSNALEARDQVEAFSGSHSSDSFNELIVSACSTCEQAQRFINQLELFSTNETLDDLSTSSIKYLIVPALYGYFLSNRNDNRLENLKLTISVHGEFSTLCSSYGIVSDVHEKKSQNAEKVSTTMTVRDQKIQRYKNRKALEERLKTLSAHVEQPHVDEDTKRDHHLTLVRYWISMVEDQLPLLEQEVQLLFSRSNGTVITADEPVPQREPIKPFILTRNAAQKAVFGAGYPSLPTMTLDEFYAEQVKRGHFPDPSSIGPPKSHSGGPSVRRIDPSVEEREAAEAQAANKDALEDENDPEQLRKAREWDAFKDEHRRGSGNRMNRS